MSHFTLAMLRLKRVKNAMQNGAANALIKSFEMRPLDMSVTCPQNPFMVGLWTEAGLCWATQSLKFELPLWISCLFTTCTALFGGRNKPNYLTKVQQDANGTFIGCSSILWLNAQQLSFLINLDPSWVIRLYPSQRTLAHSPPKREKRALFFKRKSQLYGKSQIWENFLKTLSIKKMENYFSENNWKLAKTHETKGILEKS